MLRSLVIMLVSCLLPVVSASANEPLSLYVAPAAIGTADGADAENPAPYRADAIWNVVTSEIVQRPVIVNLAAGTYDKGRLDLEGIGDGDFPLILKGDASGGSVFLLDNAEGEPLSTGLFITHCQRVVVENVTFTGPGVAPYVTRVRLSTDVTFRNCQWIDLPNVIYGAAGTADYTARTVEEKDSRRSKTQRIMFRECTFRRVGTDSHAHMVYNAYGPQHLVFVNSHFEDCSGDYVRFRDRTDYATVWNCTFVSTGTYPPQNPTHRAFVAVPVFPDKDPGDEWFGTHFLVANNTFAYLGDPPHEGWRVMLLFLHSGFSPSDRQHLMTAQEGDTLANGSPEQKRQLLERNCAIDLNEVHVWGNKLQGVASAVSFSSRPAYGAKSRGWGGMVDISDCLLERDGTMPEWVSLWSSAAPKLAAGQEAP